MDVWSKIGDCFSAFYELRILLDIDGNSAFYELRIFLDIDGNFWDCRCILLILYMICSGVGGYASELGIKFSCSFLCSVDVTFISLSRVLHMHINPIDCTEHASVRKLQSTTSCGLAGGPIFVVTLPKF
jgi:hypothetical protein